ncbi:MAG: dephospho-CoA kinase [Candidatus Riflebacteria bacterium]|nr:dephospho-CoA kinase [Candidatus Riflebacteria bacterium]
MLTVGLTGGIATGKSLVTTLLRERGAGIVDADQIYHELLGSSTELLVAMRSAFGPEIFDGNGHLDRRKLAARVFSEPKDRQRLNQITHPVIVDEMLARMDRLLSENLSLPLVFMVVPLLFEVRFQGMVDKTVLVYAPAQVQLERLMARERLSGDEARRRLGAQMPIEEKRKLADIVIDNSGSVEQTAEQLRTVLDQLVLESLKPGRKKRDPDLNGWKP